MLHPLNEPRFGAQRYHGKGARMQAPVGCQLICLQGCIGGLQHLHQPLIQMQILPTLHLQFNDLTSAQGALAVFR